LKNAEEEDEEGSNTGSDDAKVDDKASGTLSKGTSEYVRNKAKNGAELKQELDKVNEQHMLPNELKEKPVAKKSAKKGKVQGDEVKVRRESLRR
jgi:hypothetical protein